MFRQVSTVLGQTLGHARIDYIMLTAAMLGVGMSIYTALNQGRLERRDSVVTVLDQNFAGDCAALEVSGLKGRCQPQNHMLLSARPYSE